MPRKTTFFALRHWCAAATRVGASCVHGAQYDCQKLTTSTFPRNEMRLSLPLPFTSGRVKSGAL